MNMNDIYIYENIDIQALSLIIKMSDQNTVRYLIDGIGELNIIDISQDDYDILFKVVEDIKDHPYRGKIIYDYIVKYKSDKINKNNVLGTLMEACEYIEDFSSDLNGNIMLLESSDENEDGFRILEIPKNGQLCNKAVIYASGTETMWGTGQGITNEQYKMLKIIKICEVKWYKIINNEYVPITKKFKNISSVSIVPKENNMNKEMLLMCASIVSLVTLYSLDFSKNGE